MKMREVMRLVENFDADDAESIRRYIQTLAPEIDADLVIEIGKTFMISRSRAD